jgi:hypothetical protein
LLQDREKGTMSIDFWSNICLAVDFYHYGF